MPHELYIFYYCVLSYSKKTSLKCLIFNFFKSTVNMKFKKSYLIYFYKVERLGKLLGCFF